MQMINIHGHYFSNEDLGCDMYNGLVAWCQSKNYKSLAKTLHFLNPFSSNDEFDRLCRMIDMGHVKTMEERFLLHSRNYDSGTLFVALPMDFEFAGAGKPKRPYEEQLQEMAEVHKKYSNFLPFIMIDSRRKNILELLKKYVEKYNFKGIKFYFNLGYAPTDKELVPIYEYANANNLPIISHCNPDNPIYFQGKRSELKELLKRSNINVKIGMFDSNKKLCGNFGKLENYIPILLKYNNLKIDLAHLAGTYSLETLKLMLETYPYLYSDNSYRMHDKSQCELLNNLMDEDIIKDKLLQGDDWYMVLNEENVQSYISGIIETIGIEKFNKLQENNRKFLNLA